MHLVPFLATAAANFSVPLWAIIPFACLLGLIAVMPLTPHPLKAFWERFYPWIAGALGLLVAGYYMHALGVHAGAERALESLHEYAAFICLIGSLFVVSGGLHIRVAAGAAPRANLTLLGLGAVLANVIGTTGASMLLIRPYIEMNRGRIRAYHIVFFIFIVSNIGGALTPIGDPPLFLGYLRGVPFFWLLEHAFFPWVFSIGVLMAIFYAFDRRNLKKSRRATTDGLPPPEEGARIQITGLSNVVWLAAIISAVLWVPASFMLREAVMVLAALFSYKLTPARIHAQNAFTFGPIKEVAFLFFGIFLTMMPALDYLEEHGKDYALEQPYHFYFATGGLSSVLDNAPTYLNYLKLTQVIEVPEDFRKAHPDERDWTHYLIAHTDKRAYLIAISLGAVFFGAMTYIGNGPNFMVKSIAESAHIKMPSFFGYVFKYAVPYLLPVLIIVGLLFVGTRPPPQQLFAVKPIPAQASAAAAPAAQPPTEAGTSLSEEPTPPEPTPFDAERALSFENSL